MVVFQKETQRWVNNTNRKSHYQTSVLLKISSAATKMLSYMLVPESYTRTREKCVYSIYNYISLRCHFDSRHFSSAGATNVRRATNVRKLGVANDVRKQRKFWHAQRAIGVVGAPIIASPRPCLPSTCLPSTFPCLPSTCLPSALPQHCSDSMLAKHGAS